MWYANKLADIQLSDETKRTWVQLLRKGKWKHDEYGKLDFNEKLFERLVKNFDDNVRKIDLAIDAEHKPEDGACGWVKKIENRGKDGLWALVEWTSRGMTFVRDGIYRYLSVEYDPKWKDEESGRTYKDVLFGAALTNRPFIKGMAPVNLSEYKNELKNDEEIVKLAALSKQIAVVLSEGNGNMKKCNKCGTEYEGEKCPKCGSTALTEDGENADIKQTGGGKGTENRDEQVKKRETEEKKDNSGKVVASSVRRGQTLFKDENGNFYALAEDGEEEDPEKKEKEEKKEMSSKKGGKKKFEEDPEDKEDEEGKEDKKAMLSKKKKCAEDEDTSEDEKKKEKKKEDELNLSEGVMIATKKLSGRERDTLEAISLSEGSTRKILKDNLVALREGRVDTEQASIKQMLNGHFMAGKMAVAEKELWENILCNEAHQIDVAVYKFAEGDKTTYKPLSSIVNNMLSDRPVIVELREMAHSDKDVVKSKEAREFSEAKAIASRVTKRYNDPEKTNQSLSEK